MTPDMRAKSTAWTIVVLAVTVVLLVPWVAWRIATRQTLGARLTDLEKRVDALERR